MNACRIEMSNRLFLEADTAADLMTEHVVSISEDAPLREAVATLVDRGFSGAPVVNAAGRAVGVVSLSDIVVHDRNSPAYGQPVSGCGRHCDSHGRTEECAPAGRTPVRDVMTPAVCSVRPDTPARQVIEEMLLLHVHRLFVTDHDGTLVGVIATTDVLRHLLA